MTERIASSRGSARRRRFAAYALLCGVPAAALLAGAFATAQQPAARMACDDEWNGGRRGFERVCEIRELTLSPSGGLNVEGDNGGIEVNAWDRDEVLVRAKVSAWGDDEAEAREIVDAVVVETGETIRAEGPNVSNRGSWGVSYEIFAPRDTDLSLETTNGGIVVENVRGELDVQARNGAVTLRGVAGDVRGRTTNGAVDVTLTGDTWEGEALDVRTTNGAVSLTVPEGYSARLEAGTVNGAVHIDFPVTVQGRIVREISTTLGDGGPLVAVRTTNGAVHVRRY